MADAVSLQFLDDGFALVTMSNGQNRFRLQTLQRWQSVLDEVLSNKAVKGLAITGSGRFFSNGIDLDWLGEQDSAGTTEYFQAFSGVLYRVLSFPVPTVALINGHAFGGGAFLALACDFRVMRPDKGWLCWPETALGMRYGSPLIAILRTKIPPGIVQREAMLFAKRLTASDAKKFDLVDVITAEDKMLEEGKTLIKNALGKSGIERTIFETMKQDIYGNCVDFSKL